MIKIIGMCIVAVAIVFFGFSYSAKYSKRIKILESMILFIEFAENQIRYLGSRVDNIINDAIKSKNFNELFFLNDIKECENYRFCTEYQESFPLSKLDFEHISLFFDKLGFSDIEGEISHCELYKSLLNDDLLNAKSDYSNKGKLYKSMSVLIAIAVMIIFI